MELIMTPAEWYRLNLKERDIAELKSEEFFKKFKNQTGSKAGLPNYRSLLYHYKKEVEVDDTKIASDFRLDLKQKKHDKEKDLLKREVEFLQKEHIVMDRLVECLQKAVQEYRPFSLERTTTAPSSRSSVMLLSDSHVEENVSLAETHGLNEYDTAIAKQRTDATFEGLIQISREVPTDGLYIEFLGDMLSGIIHEELLWSDDLATTQALVVFADYYAKWITELTKYYPRIHVTGICGNHGRFFKKPNFKHKQTLNFDWLFYEFMRRELKDVVLGFTIPESPFWINQIQGYGVLDLHGDTIRGGQGLNSVPGAMSRDVSLLQGTLGQAGQDFQYVNVGHFHNFNMTHSFSGAQIIMNGSLIGTNEFSLNAIKRSDPPGQVWYCIEQGKGLTYSQCIRV